MVKVGFCVAYDWSLLKYSLPLIYNAADRICLSVDADRISWSGNAFTWDEEGFRKLISDIDKENKIEVLEENYHLKDLQPMENEVRQRNNIAKFLGDGGWHIQLDADEFFLNFTGFTSYLKTIKPTRNINIVCPWITLYKQDSEGFYYVQPEKFEQIEFIQIATQSPYYEYGRRNGYFNIHTDFVMLHLSWARSEEEIWEKLNNWGHAKDFDISEYFQKWKNLNRENYWQYKNLHHVKGEAWPKLGFIRSDNIEKLIHENAEAFNLPISKMQLIRRNSIWISRLKSIFSK